MTLVRTAFGCFSRLGLRWDVWVGLDAGCGSRWFESGMVVCFFPLLPISRRWILSLWLSSLFL